MKKLFVILLLIMSLGMPSNAEKESMIRMDIHNPYAVSVQMETKCDHDYYTQKYKFYKIITVPKKSHYTLVVPSNFKHCEVWVLKVKFF